VAGYFDPLIAVHARQLREAKDEGRPLIVMIATPADGTGADSILPARARAELVAGLAVVDYVTVQEDGGAEWKADVDLRGEHGRMQQDLIEHVHGRQRAAR
jgi:glycerol-3-phosphate cytidylyltransferase-like family protein